MIIPDACSLPHGVGQLPDKLARSGVAARRAWWYGLNHYAPNRHDTGSTSPRSVGEVALSRDTTSHYSRVLIAPLSNQFLPDSNGAMRSFFLRHPRARRAIPN